MIASTHPDIDAFLALGRVASVALAPGEAWLAVEIQHPDPETGRFRSSIWRQPTDGSPARPLLSARRNPRAPAFRADGGLYLLAETRVRGAPGSVRLDQVFLLPVRAQDTETERERDPGPSQQRAPRRTGLPHRWGPAGRAGLRLARPASCAAALRAGCRSTETALAACISTGDPSGSGTTGWAGPPLDSPCWKGGNGGCWAFPIRVPCRRPSGTFRPMDAGWSPPFSAPVPSAWRTWAWPCGGSRTGAAGTWGSNPASAGAGPAWTQPAHAWPPRSTCVMTEGTARCTWASGIWERTVPWMRFGSSPEPGTTGPNHAASPEPKSWSPRATVPACGPSPSRATRCGP